MQKQECTCGPVGCVRWDEHDIYCPCHVTLPTEDMSAPEVWDTVSGFPMNGG